MVQHPEMQPFPLCYSPAGFAVESATQLAFHRPALLCPKGRAEGAEGVKSWSDLSAPELKSMFPAFLRATLALGQ